MNDQQKSAIKYFIDREVSRLAGLVWEHLKATGKITGEKTGNEVYTWNRVPLIVEWYDKIGVNAAAFGVTVEDISAAITRQNNYPFKINDYRRGVA